MADGADDANNETITLRVKDQTGDEMFFKVKKNTKMQVGDNTCAFFRSQLLFKATSSLEIA